MSKCKGEVKIDFMMPERADQAMQALLPDNGDHLQSEVDGTTLILRCYADSVMGMLRTFDDALLCIRAIAEPRVGAIQVEEDDQTTA